MLFFFFFFFGAAHAITLIDTNIYVPFVTWVVTDKGWGTKYSFKIYVITGKIIDDILGVHDKYQHFSKKQLQ